MTIGQTIMTRRKAMRLNQAELAEKVGVRAPTVSLWESDSFYPGMLSLIGLADVFNISLDELVGRTFKKT